MSAPSKTCSPSCDLQCSFDLRALECQPHAGAVSRFADDVERGVMQRRHLGDISLSQADTFIAPGKLGLGLGEAVQNTLARFRCNSDSGICHFDHERAIAP